MNCDEVRNFMHDYLDNELSPQNSKEFEQSLTKCPTEFNYFDKLNKHLTKVRTLSLNFEPNKEILIKITDKLMSIKVEQEDKVKPTSKKKDTIKQTVKKSETEQIILERDIRKSVRRKKIIITFAVLSIISIFAFYFYNHFLSLENLWILEVIEGDVKINNMPLQSNQISQGDLILVNPNSQARLTLAGIASMHLNDINSLEILSNKKLNRIKLIIPNLRFISFSHNSNMEFIYRNLVINEKYAGFKFNVSSGDTGLIDVFQGFITLTMNNKKIHVVKNYRVQINDNFISLPLRKNASKYFINLANILSISPNNPDALIRILIAAQKQDVFTLFELFKTANPTNRDMILEKINNNYPLPKNISKTEVLLLYPEALEKYWTSIFEGYSK